MVEVDLAGIYRIFHLMTADYTFFSTVHGTFSETDHILGNKASLNTHTHTHTRTQIEIILCILIYHNEMKSEINSKEKHKNH
jgi:hypothetical protein